jgi:hypothetical protein
MLPSVSENARRFRENRTNAQKIAIFDGDWVGYNTKILSFSPVQISTNGTSVSLKTHSCFKFSLFWTTVREMYSG